MRVRGRTRREEGERDREREEVRLKVSAVSWLVKVHSKLRIERVYNIFYIDLWPYRGRSYEICHRSARQLIKCPINQITDYYIDDIAVSSAVEHVGYSYWQRVHCFDSAFSICTLQHRFDICQNSFAASSHLWHDDDARLFSYWLTVCH